MKIGVNAVQGRLRLHLRMRRPDRNEIIEDNILRLQQRMSLRVRGAERNEGLQSGFLKQSRVIFLNLVFLYYYSLK
jgi:hypothetical protein